MADKSFGIKELNLIGASGTPTITSPNNLNLNAGTVAISTDVTVGRHLDVDGHTELDNLNVSGVSTFAGITTVTGPSLFTKQLNVSGVSTFYGLSGSTGDIDLQHNGATRAYWDASAGTFNVRDGSSVTFGDTNDVSMSWDGTDFYLTKNTVSGSIKFTKSTGNETIAVFSNDGPVELYYDNSKKFETTTSGVNIVGTTTTGQLSVTGFSTFNYAVRFNTTSTDYIQIDSPNNRMLFPDSHSLYFGTGNDLELVHDGSTTRITNSGPFIIRNNSISGVTSISGNIIGTIADFTQSGEVRIPGQLLVGTGGTVITTTAGGLVGIGTTNPTQKLEVSGSVKVGIDTSQGVILTSPNGTKYQLFVENDGTLKTVAV